MKQTRKYPSTNPLELLQGNCLDTFSDIKSRSIDIIFCDPPYALGSKVIIRPDGKPDYEKASDFMNAWEQPDGKFWEQWFKKAYRVLKHGGTIVMFGMDRQIWFNCYYASLAGFNQQQSLYWYFISNFPKATDLGKSLDKNAKVERNVTGKVRTNTGMKGGKFKQGSASQGLVDKTEATSDLAKKYEGMKYGVSPLKQTNETILVFKKPSKTGSCLHDVIAYENGDTSISCGALDIENNRVPLAGKETPSQVKNRKVTDPRHNFNYKPGHEYETPTGGRFPAQTFCCPETSKVLDKQGKITTGGPAEVIPTKTSSGRTMSSFSKQPFNSVRLSTEGEVGGVSKILHKCAYDQDDIDLYIYCAKVTKTERNKGLKGKKLDVTENNHPTVKPTELLTKVLKLFKTPNPQIVFDPFMGSGSIGLVAQELNMNYIGVELDPTFYSLAKHRNAHTALDHWKPKTVKNKSKSTKETKK